MSSTRASPPQSESSLPEPSYPGVFSVYVSVDIDAPVDKVWAVLTDFTKYPEWNPFTRTQVIVDKYKKPLEDQTPAEGKYLLIRSHIPPTMDDSAPTTEDFEQITHFDDVTHRMTFQNLFKPAWVIQGERSQVLSATEDGKTRYESREVFGGVGAYFIRWFLAARLQQSFDAMGGALKTRAEQQ